MKVSITIEAMLGGNWPLWKQIIPQFERMGFTSIFRSDHFSPDTPPKTDELELITSLTYLADHTQRVNFGSLVAPLSVRDPVMLARQAMSLNNLSGGRMVLGVGAGWMVEEHTRYGYPLGDTKTRLDRLEEGLEVISSLLRCEEPVNYQGRFFRLEEARLLPRPKLPTRILVGGNGPKRTLPLVAKYADIWNCQLETPDEFQRLSALLDENIHAQGRVPGDVKRTLMLPVLCFHSSQEILDVFCQFRTIPALAGMSDEDFTGVMSSMKCIFGKPDEVIQKMLEYSKAGVEEFIVQWMGLVNLEALQTIAEEILPNVL